MRLVVGNSLSGERPAEGMISFFRVGSDQLDVYPYETLELRELSETFPGPESVKLDEVARYFERDNDPRASTRADVFVLMRTDEGYERKGWRTSNPQHLEGKSDPPRGFSSEGVDGQKVLTLGLSFSLFQETVADDPKEYPANQAYFDNASLEVSNVLWEFSPDSGKEKWYQMYTLPNKAYCRMSFPTATNRIRARALSDNPDEWVQAFTIKPVPNYQIEGREFVFSGNVKVDGFGYVTWPKASGGFGTPIYRLYLEDGGELIATTRDTHYQLAEYWDFETRYYVEAEDAAGNVIKMSME